MSRSRQRSESTGQRSPRSQTGTTHVFLAATMIGAGKHRSARPQAVSAPALTMSHGVSLRSPHNRSTRLWMWSVSPGQRVLTTSFATRGSRVQIPSAPLDAPGQRVFLVALLFARFTILLTRAPKATHKKRPSKHLIPCEVLSHYTSRQSACLFLESVYKQIVSAGEISSSF